MVPPTTILLPCCFLCTVALNVLNTAAAQHAAPQRVAWQYTDATGGTVTIKNVEARQWVADRPGKRVVVYAEVGRTPDFVELQNTSSKLRMRLYADHAEWFKVQDQQWKRYFNGKWVAATATPPVAVPDIPASPGPRPATDHRLRLVYFVPEDREPLPTYQQKIRVVVTYVSTLYQTDLQAKGYRTKGLSFESDNDGQPIVQLVRGAKPASYYNNAPRYDADEQWRRLVPEIRTAVPDASRRVVVVFAETYDDGPAKALWPGVIARGAYYSADSGLGIYTAHILRDEFCALNVRDQGRLFFDTTPIVGRTALGHRPNSPRCEFVEDGFGAVAHELGHALGLPHDRRDDRRYIMGNGFRNLRWNLPAARTQERVGFSTDNARLLMSSRYLADDVNIADDIPPAVELELVGESVRPASVSVKGTDAGGLRAVVLVDRTQGSVIGGAKLSGKHQDFQYPLPPEMAAQASIELLAIVTDDGGNQTRVTRSFQLGSQPAD